MKIIDLLHKIANGKSIPQKIKWGCHILEWQVYHYVAIDDYGKPDFFELSHGISRFMLNDEVEVIGEKEMCHKCGKYPAEYNQTYCEFCLGISEEDKKIEKLEEYSLDKDGKYEITPTLYEQILKNKINEIIDKINKGE